MWWGEGLRLREGRSFARGLSALHCRAKAVTQFGQQSRSWEPAQRGSEPPSCGHSRGCRVAGWPSAAPGGFLAHKDPAVWLGPPSCTVRPESGLAG